MTFAQTTVEDPKYGCSRREAVISIATDPTPAQKTTAASTASPRRTKAAAPAPAAPLARREPLRIPNATEIYARHNAAPLNRNRNTRS